MALGNIAHLSGDCEIRIILQQCRERTSDSRPERSPPQPGSEPVYHQAIDHGSKMQAGARDDKAMPKRVVEA